jgi:flagellar hook protein FlgE
MDAAISGLEAHQTMLDVTANNLANVDTIGYKSQRTTFVDELSQTLNPGSGVSGSNAGSNPEQVGLGVDVGSIDNLMGAGSLQTTGNPLDIAIQGDGFLQVGNGLPGAGGGAAVVAPGNGEETTYPAPPAPSPAAFSTVQYTRAGNLTINPAGFLSTQSGQYVVGQAAKGTPSSTTPPTYTYAPATPPGNSYINIPPGSTNVAIGKDGSVTYTDQSVTSAGPPPVLSPTNGMQVTAGYLTLATFPNEAGLTRDGGSLWSASQNSGAATIGTPNVGAFGSTIAGSLEMSNVDMATEFTNMITAERGYQANAQVITTGNTMLQTLIQMPQG